jgi:glutaconyl-CoA decarboxylase
MKQYRITLEGQAFDVRVLGDPRRDRVEVEVDGEMFTVGVEAVPVVAEVAAGAVPLPAAPVSPVPSPPGGTMAAGGAAPPGSSEVEGGVVSSPLPGVVKSIVVRSGQRVAANDELVVIEAMKMDNVIRAPRDGVVTTIHVSEGRQVAYGEPLLEIDSE